MEALSRKAEKEKLAELEAMLADATLSGDITGEFVYNYVCILVWFSRRSHLGVHVSLCLFLPSRAHLRDSPPTKMRYLEALSVPKQPKQTRARAVVTRLCISTLPFRL